MRTIEKFRMRPSVAHDVTALCGSVVEVFGAARHNYLVAGRLLGWEYPPVTNAREWLLRLHFEGFVFDLDQMGINQKLYEFVVLELVTGDENGTIKTP